MPFAWDTARFPFSFSYDGKPSCEFLPRWTSTPAPKRTDGYLSQQYLDPDGGLGVNVLMRRFEDFPACEWVLQLTNAGPSNSPMIADLRALDLEIAAQDSPVLHYAHGSRCQIDDFVPSSETLPPQSHRRIMPKGGRSSNGVLPFMNLQLRTGGLVVAIGWSGQWMAEFSCSDETVRVTAGLEHLATYLRPGESIRSPRILLIDWEGDDPDTGTNLLRQVLLAHYSQRRADGSLATPPTAHPRQLLYYFTGHVSEEDHLAAIDRAREIGLEAFWVDALWYGEGDEWWAEVGNWTVNRKRFPNGLRPIADKAHANGMQFILWFEPERVRPQTPVASEHPEYLLRHPGEDGNLLLDLGNPEARRWITDRIAGVLDEVGVDVYRQDHNFDPLAYWLAHDEPGRAGMTEMRHIEGLYAMWDELRARRPGLLIDNCASGGRRIDLETTLRSFSLWRSDYTDAGVASAGHQAEIGAQCQTAGLSRWLPLHSAAVWTLTPYAFRSSVSTGVVFYPDIRPDDYPVDAARAAIAERDRLQTLMLGDHHLLLPLTTQSHDWCAYQFHRPDLAAGFAFFFRRQDSPFPTLECSLRQIDDAAEYDVTVAQESWEREAPKRMPGSELLELKISVPSVGTSVLLEYRKV